MAYTKSPRPYKHEYELQKARGEHKYRMERQRARRKFDKENGPAKRKGNNISHNKPLRNGGTNADGYTLQSPSKNRANNGKKKKKT